MSHIRGALIAHTQAADRAADGGNEMLLIPTTRNKFRMFDTTVYMRVYYLCVSWHAVCGSYVCTIADL